MIVLGTFKMAMTLLDTGIAPAMPAVENSSIRTVSRSPAGIGASPAMPAQTTALDDIANADRTAVVQQRHSGNSDGMASLAIPQNSVSPSASRPTM